MKQVRVAVVGVGDWGEKHVQALKSLEGVELAAVCDTNRKRAKEIARRHRIKRAYSDFSEMVEKERLDFVDVVTPERSHLKPVLEAAKRGIHVFVEKPIAATLEDADRMLEAARRRNVFLTVGHILRWDVRYAMIRDMIMSGRMGRIGAVLARRAFSRAGASRYLPYVSPIMQSAVHDIDLILWYTGSRVVECYSRSSRLLRFAKPDTTVSMLSLANGTEAILENSFALPERVPFLTGARMEIIASKSFAVVDATEQSLFFCDEGGWHAPDTTLVPTVMGGLKGTLREEMAYFARCVSTGKAPTVITPQEAREALRVALACERSLAEGKPVRLARS